MNEIEAFELDAHSLAATRQLGSTIGRHLVPGLVVTLQGTLGAGKTFLVQSVAESLGIPRNHVTSPTFSLIQQFAGRINVIHIDAYRIADEDEYLELGIDELLDGESAVFMEWAEKFQELLPADHLAVSIEVVDTDSRRIRVAWPATDSLAATAGRAIRLELAHGAR